MRMNSPITKIPGVGNAYAQKLKRIGIENIKDLLWHVPHRYLDFSRVEKIVNIKPGDIATVRGEIASAKNHYTRFGRNFQKIEIVDDSGKISATWFNQPYLINSFSQGQHISIAGKVGEFGNKLSFLAPEFEKHSLNSNHLHTGRLIPVYPETKGVSSKWLRSKIDLVFQDKENKFDDHFTSALTEKWGLIGLSDAYKYVHYPADHDQVALGRKRLAFDELFFLHLNSLYTKSLRQKKLVSHKLKFNTKVVNEFIGSLAFKLTPSQTRSVEQILADICKLSPMNRLLEGDVGSGKTIVAAIAAFANFTAGFQSVLMAPTQILAEQHFYTIKNLLEPYKIRIALLTSSVSKIDIGKNDIFIGTHTLLHKHALFENVAFIVIDEQHRFGVEQRKTLMDIVSRNGKTPHVLTMTATPIPRTIALTAYGDLDLSVLDELPKGRQRITTWIVPSKKRDGAYGWIKEQIKKEKVQVFIICPLIDESEAESMQNIKAAKTEYERLKTVFKGLKLGLLHGKMKGNEKSNILEDFKKGKIDILVSTPVIEVGIDVPNATIMMIEGADRFGLAQLHQLRGRVGRGSKKSYALVFADNLSKISYQRLSALKSTLSGFELAELDLKLRGPGEILGIKQHGFPDLKVASWSDFDLITLSKRAAETIIKQPKRYSRFFKIILENVADN